MIYHNDKHAGRCARVPWAAVLPVVVSRIQRERTKIYLKGEQNTMLNTSTVLFHVYATRELAYTKKITYRKTLSLNA